MNRACLAVAASLLLMSSSRAMAVCDYANPDPESTWTAAWTNPSGYRTYSLEAPCKVYVGIPFTYTARVQVSPECPASTTAVASDWRIVDNGEVRIYDATWIHLTDRDWVDSITTTYFGEPIDHTIEFVFTDLGGTCYPSGMFWSPTTHIVGLTVDPYPPPNAAPVVEAGPDVALASKEQWATTIAGSASDADGEALSYRWLEGAAELQGFRPVDASGAAPLALSPVPALSLGTHVFTLEVTDGHVVVADTVTVSVANSPPVAAPFSSGKFELGESIPLTADVADFDGGTLTYRWLEGDAVLAEGTVVVEPGTATALPAETISGLALGDHLLTLIVSDGIDSSSAELAITVQDTIAPTLAPVASARILWPPSGQMIPVTVIAHARDSSGAPLVLTASVSTDQPSRLDDLGNPMPEYAVLGIDQAAGTISLELRADKPRGQVRTYWISVTAIDTGGNSTNAQLTVVVPHDQRP